MITPTACFHLVGWKPLLNRVEYALKKILGMAVIADMVMVQSIWSRCGDVDWLGTALKISSIVKAGQSHILGSVLLLLVKLRLCWWVVVCGWSNYCWLMVFCGTDFKGELLGKRVWASVSLFSLKLVAFISWLLSKVLYFRVWMRDDWVLPGLE